MKRFAEYLISVTEKVVESDTRVRTNAECRASVYRFWAEKIGFSALQRSKRIIAPGIFLELLYWKYQGKRWFQNRRCPRTDHNMLQFFLMHNHVSFYINYAMVNIVNHQQNIKNIIISMCFMKHSSLHQESYVIDRVSLVMVWAPKKKCCYLNQKYPTHEVSILGAVKTGNLAHEQAKGNNKAQWEGETEAQTLWTCFNLRNHRSAKTGPPIL